MSEVAKPNTFDSPLRYYGWLLLLYTLNHGWVLLLAGAIFWDDWTLYGVSEPVLVERAKQAGTTWWYPLGHIQALLLQIGPWLHRTLTFVLMFSAGIAVDRILRRQPFISASLRHVIVVLFLVLPLYWARVALIDIHYTVCYFLFFLAWALMGRYRLLSLALFFISFSTNSLLVFFALPFIDVCAQDSRQQLGMGSVMRAAVRRMDFALLPIAYFVSKNIWFRPYGIYAGYNEDYSARNLLLQPLAQWNDLVTTVAGFIGLFRVSSGTILTLQFVVAVAAVAILITLARGGSGPFVSLFRAPKVDRAHRNRLVGIGVVTFVAGAFPYWVVGKAPTFADWGSRHQLLLPLGMAVVLATIIMALRVGRSRVLAALVCMCTFANTYAYMAYVADWSKQKQLIAALRESDLVAKAGVVVFDDESTEWNAHGRRYRYYEWCGLVSEALGDDSRLGTNPEDLVRFQAGDLNPKLTGGLLHRRVTLELRDSVNTVLVTVSNVRPASLWERARQLGLPRIRVQIETLPPIRIVPIQDEQPSRAQRTP